MRDDKRSSPDRQTVHDVIGARPAGPLLPGLL